MEAQSFTAIGEIVLTNYGINNKNNSINKAAFFISIENILCCQLWIRAVVVRENLRAHKLALILLRIEVVGASVIYLSHTIPYFNPIEQWLSQLKSFLLWFAPPTTSTIDTIIAVALNKHEASTFKKLGKLMADNVPHNSSSYCYCYQTPSAKAKST
ncbi:hypothetical protein [Microcoleus sp. herbarium2]|uniref:hypothetical protein n=1 Tax=Microcoleus sp. herbarium2 TaxID=3055433 RepID=UPI002FD3782F